MVIVCSKGSKADEASRHADRIRSLCKHGHLEEAFTTVESMERHHVFVSRDIVYSLLRGCHGIKNPVYPRRIHLLMRKHGLSSVTALGDHLIRLFAACGSIHEANKAFSDVSNPSIFTWNSLISAHTKLGEGFRALHLYEKMQQANQVPDRVTFVCVCHACGCIGAWMSGMHMHHQAIRHGFESNVVLGNALIDMYAKCGCLAEARRLFDTQVEKDMVTWTVIMSGYAAQGQGLPALELYVRIHRNGLQPSKPVMLCAIRACICEGALNEGQLIHGETLEDGLGADMVLMSSLVDMYAKCGCLVEATKVFSALPARDIVAWTAMIDGYAHSDYACSVFPFFERMLQAGIEPNEATFLGILKACSAICTTENLQSVHSHIMEEGLEINVAIGSALVDNYARCALLEDAYAVFTRLTNKNIVTWATVISGFLDCGQASKSLELFNESLFEGIEPNVIMCLCVLRACSSIEAIDEGLLVHSLVYQMGYESDKAIGNTLVNFYAKNGDIDAARIMFDCLSSADTVSFGALISGYCQQGWNALALDLFDEMCKHGVFPDRATFLSLLRACSSIGALGQGHLLHKQIVMNGLESASVVKNALVDMYVKTGKLDEAHLLCVNQLNYDVVSCASILRGYKYGGDLKDLEQLIEDLRQVGCDPDNVMLASILSACSSMGLLHEGYDLFTSICGNNSLIPSQENCSSIVDLLGRVGQLQAAKDMSITMPMPPDLTRQTSLATNSKTYSNMGHCS